MKTECSARVSHDRTAPFTLRVSRPRLFAGPLLPRHATRAPAAPVSAAPCCHHISPDPETSCPPTELAEEEEERPQALGRAGEPKHREGGVCLTVAAPQSNSSSSRFDILPLALSRKLPQVKDTHHTGRCGPRVITPSCADFKAGSGMKISKTQHSHLSIDYVPGTGGGHLMKHSLLSETRRNYGEGCEGRAKR